MEEAAQAEVTPPGPRARYRVRVLTSLLLSLSPFLPPQDAPVVDAVDVERSAILGPVLGDLQPRSAKIWLRSGDGADVEWSLSTGDEIVDHGTLSISDERDRTAVLSLTGLRPHTDYLATLTIGPNQERPVEEQTVAFKTLQRHDDADSVRIAFGSCASHDRFESQPIWTAIARTNPRALVLLGDTPYIDSTNLARQRKRYREFWSIPELRPLAASVPVYSTWDDHDFATNDQVGAQPGRENSRRVFIEYHAQPSFGDGELGIDTSFRSGPVEVFLIDTRWYGDEERWPENDADGELTSLLGRRQREALIASVIASTADVKVLSCGMVWNGAVRPGKRDHWGTWAHERDAILGALGKAGVKGVVLVGGDIHIPRVIRHVAAEEHLGYVPVELVSSPLANQPIPAATAPHPGLVWNVQAPSVALILEVERGETAPRVVARFIGPDGDALYVHSLAPADLGY